MRWTTLIIFYSDSCHKDGTGLLSVDCQLSNAQFSFWFNFETDFVVNKTLNLIEYLYDWNIFCPTVGVNLYLYLYYITQKFLVLHGVFDGWDWITCSTLLNKSMIKMQLWGY